MPNEIAAVIATKIKFPSTRETDRFLNWHKPINTHKGKKLSSNLIVLFLNALISFMKAVFRTVIRITGTKKTT